MASHTNICIDCQNSCGGCSWSAVNPVTGKILFEPVPGWTAKKVLLNLGKRSRKGKKIYDETYHITACPQYVPVEQRKV
jgi:hypothetical protein